GAVWSGGQAAWQTFRRTSVNCPSVIGPRVERDADPAAGFEPRLIGRVGGRFLVLDRWFELGGFGGGIVPRRGGGSEAWRPKRGFGRPRRRPVDRDGAGDATCQSRPVRGCRCGRRLGRPQRSRSHE